jgi:hypothetical protein
VLRRRQRLPPEMVACMQGRRAHAPAREEREEGRACERRKGGAARRRSAQIDARRRGVFFSIRGGRVGRDSFFLPWGGQRRGRVKWD